MILLLLSLMVLIFAWAVYQLIKILDDRVSYRKDRAQLLAALQASEARADQAEKELKQLRYYQEQNAPYYERLHKQVKTYQRMIYGEMRQKQKNHPKSATASQRTDD